MAVAAKFNGDGAEYLSGVPARDLDADDFEALDDDRKAAVEASPLYRVRPAKAESDVAAEPKAKAAGGKKGA